MQQYRATKSKYYDKNLFKRIFLDDLCKRANKKKTFLIWDSATKERHDEKPTLNLYGLRESNPSFSTI